MITRSALQNAVLALLALAVVGIYAGYALRSPAEGNTTVAARTPKLLDVLQDGEEPHVDDVPVLEARSLSEGLFETGTWRGKPALADLNGDGHLDLLASLRRWSSDQAGEGLHVWLGDGGGSWRLSVDGLRRDMGYGGVRADDVDGDGHPDIAFSGHDVHPQVFLGDGTGSWTEASEGLYAEGSSTDVALGDIEGDGAHELVVVGQFPDRGGLYVFSRREEGDWTLREELLGADHFGSQVRLADLDGDERLEILACTDLGPRVWRLREGAIVDDSEGLPTPEIAGSDLGIASHDFDGDGVHELVVAGMVYEGHEPLRIFRRGADGVWERWGQGLPQDEAAFDLELGDVDGDGRPEILTAGKYGVTVVRSPELGRFERQGRIAGTEAILHLTAGDVDGDGKDEIVCQLADGIRVFDLERGSV